MFIKIKKNCGIFMEHNGLEKQHWVPVTSNFLINLDHVAEVSFYTIKEKRTRYDLENHQFAVQPHTRVLPVHMAYTYSTMKENINGNKGNLVERSYYKLYFLPEEMGQYDELRNKIEEHVLNL
jgi:hypothetical protein